MKRKMALGTLGPAGPAVSLMTGAVYEVGIAWPVYVTSGLAPDGSLRTLTFNSREDADRAGYRWVGKIRHR